LDYSPAKKLKR